MTTALQQNSEAAHDRSVRDGKTSLMLGLRGLSLVLAGLGSTGNETLVEEANDVFEQALTADNPALAEAFRGLAHELASLIAGFAVLPMVSALNREAVHDQEIPTTAGMAAILRAPTQEVVVEESCKPAAFDRQPDRAEYEFGQIVMAGMALGSI